MKKIDISRRQFVSALAASGILAGLSLAGCSPKPQIQGESEGGTDENADVVIVGGGLSGMMAASVLHRSYPNLKVVLLEQQDFLGGSVKYSDGYFIGFSDRYNTDPADCATPEQMVTLVDKAAKDVEDHGFSVRGDAINTNLSYNVFGNLSDTITELLDMNVPFEAYLDTSTPYSHGAYSDDVYAVCTENLGEGFSSAMIASLTAAGIDVRTSSQVTSLIVANDAVTGVKVKSGKSQYQINASAVLLAMGGFGANPEKIGTYLPQFANCSWITNPGATGMALDFVEEFGTEIVSDGVFGGMVANDDSYVTLESGFFVNEEGKRFANESENWYLMLWAITQNTKNAAGWFICDNTYATEHEEEVQFKLNQGSLVEYATLAELCAATGIDQEGLEATIASYNAAVDAGINPEFDLPVALAHKVETAPFYAEKSSSFCFGTIKGIKVDENCRVLRGDGTPVAGLYASGETAAGNVFFGQYPSGGSGNCIAAVMGRYAAKTIAESL